MQVHFPPALQFLFSPSRYKVVYGGRGGAKSWGMARALLVKGAGQPLRILCARETQESISESVHRLLADQIKAIGLESFYHVQQNAIYGVTGTEFSFAGLRHNVLNIRSLEGTDIVWVEEAHAVSHDSWETLIPTIRKTDSEIWVSFNPQDASDDTYQRFVVNPSPRAVVRKVTWRDNPWFPDVLRAEMEELRAKNEDEYRHVWEGDVRATPGGALWTRQQIDANRIRLQDVRFDALLRIVVAIDPAVSTKPDSSDTGIVVAALTNMHHVLVLDDLSCKESPLGWARIAVNAYRSRNADRIVGEINNGGDLVEANIRAVAPEVSFRSVRASRGKAVRAEPVSALYEKGLVHHVGFFPELEQQMCGWSPLSDQKSPDRMDALVWAVTELVVDPEPQVQQHQIIEPVRISAY